MLASFLFPLLASALDLSVMQAPAWRDAPDWRLVWADEFNGARIDPACWAPFTERSGNNPEDEAQRFTASDRNHFVKDGVLTIRALRETTDVEGKVKHFTSAQLMTNKLASWQYARFEARIKVPKGAGFWPAFWMMPENDRYGGWPKGGEVDIMEMIGREPNTNIAVAHYFDYRKNAHRALHASWVNPAPLDEAFHVYALDWTADGMVWSFDGQPYFQAKGWPTPPGGGKGAPYDQPFYLIVNLSVGGKWSGLPTAQTPFPGDLQIDYVRVYQTGAGGPAKTCNGELSPPASASRAEAIMAPT